MLNYTTNLKKWNTIVLLHVISDMKTWQQKADLRFA